MLLGIDLGTGSVKALLLSENGDVLASASAEYPVRAPRSGYAESDPLDWWDAAAKVVREVAADAETGEIEAIGFSGQMHGVVVCGESGEPLRPAVLWADTRTSLQLEAYRDLDAGLLRRFANPPAVGMAGPTLLWLRENEPETYRATRYALQPKDWLRFRMTGEAGSEPSDASAMLLYDLRDDRWYTELLDALGLDAGMFAPLSRATDIAGTLTKEASGHLGLRAGIPVAVGAADTAAAIIGTGLSEPGTFQLTVGTGAQLATLRDSFSPDETGRTHLFRTAPPTTAPYYAMAAMQNAGLALERVRKMLGVSWARFYDEAFSDGIEPGAGGVTFVPHLGGERTPGFDADARGAWRNLGLEHERGHLLRAALEGVAFSIRDGLEALEAATGENPDSLRLAGGGSADPRWREMLASVLGKRLDILPESVSANASSVGAAYIAAFALEGVRVVSESPEPERYVEPDDASLYDEAFARYRDLTRSGA